MPTRKTYLRKAHVRVLRNGRKLYVPPKIIQPKQQGPEPKGKNKGK
jgi:hypothetical protein